MTRAANTLTEEERQECTALASELECARAELSDVLFEIDDILLQQNPHIESDYAVKIGYLEYELLKAQLAARRAKRKTELALTQANAGQAIGEDAIEERLETEFIRWQQLVQQQADEYAVALEHRLGSFPLGQTDSKKLKELHHCLIKRLHPDLHPGDGDRRRLFLLAQSAYEKGDLAALQSLEAMTRDGDSENSSAPQTPDELRAEIELVGAQTRVMRERLEQIKGSNPYALREKLADPAWLGETTAALQGEITTQKRAAEYYTRRFDELKGDSR